MMRSVLPCICISDDNVDEKWACCLCFCMCASLTLLPWVTLSFHQIGRMPAIAMTAMAATTTTTSCSSSLLRQNPSTHGIATPTCSLAFARPRSLSRTTPPVDLTASFFSNVRSAVTASGKGCRAQVTMMPIGTPKVPYRTPNEGGWQWVDIWNVLYRERIIFLGQYIDEEFGNQVVATMLYLDSIENTKPLFLYINSPGGDMTPCMAIYDTMESIKSPVGTLALGYAYNNAGFLLGAGTKGLRTAMPLTRIALQSPAGSARGQADDILNEAKELSRVRNYVYNQVARKTGQPLEKVTKDLSRIKRFNAQEALDYGLIDRIIRPRRIKPDARRQDAAGVGLG